jgi:hypothetical protein
MTDDSLELSLLDESGSQSGLDIAEDLRRLSAEAMSALESITDEVDAMEKKDETTPKATSNLTLSFDKTSGTRGSVGSGRMTSTTGEQETSLKHLDDIDICDDEDDDELSFDGSIAREIDALRRVAQEIERELQFQDGDTSKDAIEDLPTPAEEAKERILTPDDHEIIRRALFDELKKYEPKNGWERFMKRYQLEGLNEDDMTYILAAACAMIWSIVLWLVFQVKYGELL